MMRMHRDPPAHAAWPEEQVEVTARRREEAVQYFRDRQTSIATWAARVPADGPEQAQAAPFAIRKTVYPKGWPDPAGPEVLQNDYPAPISVAGRTYASVAHGYWALSTDDLQAHDQIAAAERGYHASKLGEALLATGDARLMYLDFDSGYWVATGQHWTELIHASSAIQRELITWCAACGTRPFPLSG